MTDWQPIETAPKDNTGIVVIAKDLKGRWLPPRIVHWTARNRWALAELGVGLLYEPTHWQPLPEPPK